MYTYIRIVSLLVFINPLFIYSAYAAQINQNVSSKQPVCHTLDAEKVLTMGPSDLKQIAISPGSAYFKYPCYRYVVEFVIPSNSGETLAMQYGGLPEYKKFYFDSISNELINTQEKCMHYYQSTRIFKKQNNGAWLEVAKGNLKGKWQGGKCKFSPPQGQSDFRSKAYSPEGGKTVYYRVASTISNGAPSLSNQAVVQRVQTQAHGYMVCIAAEHPQSANIPIEGCADPNQ